MLAAGPGMTGLDRALKISPGNPAYWIRRADLLDRDLASPSGALEHAAALNPFDADVWIRLGLDAEAHRDYSRAEAYLVRAARVSRRYQPRWTLANYYFRRGAEAPFWNWTRQALELEPEHPAALFQLCWRMRVAPSEIFDKAIPPRRAIRREYARFLLSQDRLDAAGPVVRRLLADPQPDDRDLLLEASDRFLAAQKIDLAAAAWNTLCDRKLLACTSTPASGSVPLDSATSAVALGHGFAWHTVETPGISVDLRSGLITAEFSGNEPESAGILWRWIPVHPGTAVRLSFEYQTSGLSPGSGLTWQVLAAGNAAPLASTPSLSAPGWSPEQLAFEIPAGVEAVRLRLNYSRPPGKVRIEGSASVRALRIERTP